MNGKELKALYESPFISALHLGHSKLEVDYSDRAEATLFILDALQTRDLIDFWNLRAVHQRVIAIPVQWLQELSPVCKRVITDYYRPLRGNPHGIMESANIIFSRSIPEEDIKGLVDTHLRPDDKEVHFSVQTWYPPIWRRASDHVFSVSRPIIKGAEKSINLPLDIEKAEVRFDLLHPEFANQYGGEYRWVNVVEMRDWSYKNRIATVFPCDYRNPVYPKFGLARHQPLPTTEGLVIFPRYQLPERWDLVDGNTAISEWFKENKITTSFSDAGRSTQQIIETLGGFWGVRSIPSLPGWKKI